MGLRSSSPVWTVPTRRGGPPRTPPESRRQGALLALVYVQPLSPAGAALGAPVVQASVEAADQLGAEVRAAVGRVTDVHELRWEFHTLRGGPYSALSRAAHDLRADAVVVGASEQAGHRFVGSVAVRLVKAGRWPVTVVP